MYMVSIETNVKNDNIHKTKAVSVAIGIAHPFKVGWLKLKRI